MSCLCCVALSHLCLCCLVLSYLVLIISIRVVSCLVFVSCCLVLSCLVLVLFDLILSCGCLVRSCLVMSGDCLCLCLCLCLWTLTLTQNQTLTLTLTLTNLPSWTPPKLPERERERREGSVAIRPLPTNTDGREGKRIQDTTRQTKEHKARQTNCVVAPTRCPTYSH